MVVHGGYTDAEVDVLCEFFSWSGTITQYLDSAHPGSTVWTWALTSDSTGVYDRSGQGPFVYQVPRSVRHERVVFPAASCTARVLYLLWVINPALKHFEGTDRILDRAKLAKNSKVSKVPVT